MPWHIEKREDQFCVIKDADGENEGCHDSREKAQAQMRALYASENRSEPVEMRASSITAVDQRQRIVDLIAVPWEQEAEVLWQGEPWREVFSRGAFAGIEDHAGRIRVNREHVFGHTVGKVVRFADEAEGLRAQVKVAKSDRGDETLALAEEDMISASVGFRIKQPSDVQVNRRTHLRRVNRAFIDHLAMVEAPAYTGAQVLSVRAGRDGLQVVEQKALPTAPGLDEYANDPIFAWAQERLTRVGSQDKGEG